jgi:hypothetical protein
MSMVFLPEKGRDNRMLKLAIITGPFMRRYARFKCCLPNKAGILAIRLEEGKLYDIKMLNVVNLIIV